MTSFSNPSVHVHCVEKEAQSPIWGSPAFYMMSSLMPHLQMLLPLAHCSSNFGLEWRAPLMCHPLLLSHPRSLSFGCSPHLTFAFIHVSAQMLTIQRVFFGCLDKIRPLVMFYPLILLWSLLSYLCMISYSHPHHWQVPYLGIYLLAKIYLPATQNMCVVIHVQERVANHLSWPNFSTCSQLRLNKVTACFIVLVLILWEIVLFMVYFMLYFYSFGYFFWGGGFTVKNGPQVQCLGAIQSPKGQRPWHAWGSKCMH